MLFNNARSRPHAYLYGVGAFYDLGLSGRQATMATDLTPGQHCCVATPMEGDTIEFAWYRFSHEWQMPDPDETTSLVRVFYGERLGAQTLPRHEATANPHYASFFDINGNFKRQSAIRPEGECVAPAGLQ